MKLILSLLLFAAACHAQNFEEELSTILKPPPLPSPLQKNDFATIQFVQDNTPFIPSVLIPAVQPTPAVVKQATPNAIPKQLAHHAVLFNSEQEAQLPSNLINPFYKDPRIANVLAKESWFTPGEKHVTDRETEKIPRDRIYYALKSAGLIRRRRSAVPMYVPYPVIRIHWMWKATSPFPVW